MSEPHQKTDHQKRYEDSTVSVKQLFAFAMGIVALVLVGVLVSAFTFKFFERHTPMGPSASPFDESRELPPGLHLQTNAPEDLKNYRDAQDKTLAGYGWVDPKAGVVRIPVERAMQILLQKGYPVRGSSPVNGQASVPGEAGPPGSPLIAPTPMDGEEVR
jgi:hypothetical protein